MSLKYRNGQGVETPLAGLNGTSGELVPSATYLQKGVFAVPDLNPTVLNYTSVNVTLTAPMPDDDYIVVIEGCPTGIGTNPYAFTIRNKTTTGFTVIATTAFQDVTMISGRDIEYQAFKLITVEEIALDEQAITDIQEVIPSTATTANKLVTQSELTAAISDAINNLSALIYG